MYYKFFVEKRSNFHTNIKEYRNLKGPQTINNYQIVLRSSKKFTHFHIITHYINSSTLPVCWLTCFIWDSWWPIYLFIIVTTTKQVKFYGRKQFVIKSSISISLNFYFIKFQSLTTPSLCLLFSTPKVAKSDDQQIN